jgi:hypothetical protein
MHRLPDWETRLAAFLEPLRLRAFAWGKHDCCIFTAGAVEAMTGVDAMAEFRGRYSTQIGAKRARRSTRSSSRCSRASPSAAIS